MRGYRAILFVKLVLLAVLLWLVASLPFQKKSEQQPIGDSESKAPKVKVELSRKPTPLTDYNAILERDLFGPMQADEIHNGFPKDGLTASSEPIGERQLQLRLLGTVAGSEKVARAVIEDVKTKEQGLYKTGDVIQEARISKIERNRIILLRNGVQEILDLHVASPTEVASDTTVGSRADKESSVADAVKVISPTEREINKGAFLDKIGGMGAVLKTVEASPYVVDGQEEGLRITGIEGLSMARYVGFENGDVIQTINGQNVTDKRKTFQVLQKARSMPSSDIQILRGSQKMMFYFKFN